MAQTTLQPPPEARPARALPSRAGRPRRRRRPNWFAYGLVAPAVSFMVLVHLLPTVGGVVLSFKRLNTFTFARLFDAPWTGWTTTAASSSTARTRCTRASGTPSRTRGPYTFWTVGGTIGGGLLVALLLNRPMRASGSCAR